MKVKIPQFECKRCGHQWLPRKSEIRMCPKCKSPYWDTPKKKVGGSIMKTIMILATLAIPCFADEVILKDGRRVDFKSLEDSGETYTIVTPEGVRMVVKRSEVTGFEKTEPAVALTGATMSFGKKDKLDSVDLLKKIETDKDFLAGVWRFQPDGSLVLAAPTVVEHGTCQIRYTPSSDEYNLTLVMERTEGEDNIGVTLQLPGGRQCQYYFDIHKGKFSGILTPGAPYTKASVPAPGRQFAVKKPRTVVFMVRKTGLVVQVDGVDVTTLRSDWTNIAPFGGPQVGGAQAKGAFGISALASGLRISKAVLTQKS